MLKKEPAEAGAVASEAVPPFQVTLAPTMRMAGVSALEMLLTRVWPFWLTVRLRRKVTVVSTGTSAMKRREVPLGQALTARSSEV